MTFTRRDMLVSLSGCMAGAALGTLQGISLEASGPALSAPAPPGSFPRQGDFTIAEGYTYVNGVYTHPMPIVSAEAYNDMQDIDRLLNALS